MAETHPKLEIFKQEFYLMETTMQESQKQTIETQRPFSLTIYLFIVAVLSWPFQIASAIGVQHRQPAI